MDAQKKIAFSYLILLLLFCGKTFSQDEYFSRLEKELGDRGDLTIVNVSRSKTKDKTIELEILLSRDGDLDYLSKILSDFPKFKGWVLPGLNDRPTGGKFYVQFIDIETTLRRPSDIQVSYTLELPLFKHQGSRWLKLQTKKSDSTLEGTITSYPNEKSVIKNVEGFIRAYRAKTNPNRIWAYLKGFAEIGPWILYEALPEDLVQREMGPRVSIIVKNYLNEEATQMDQPENPTKPSNP